MKKTLFFGLMAAALGFTACSDENGSIFNEKPQKGMTLNATVNGGIDTRANIDNTDAVWPFTFSAGDEVKVTNDLVTDTYTFSKAASDFTCDDATPTASATTWHAYYPSSAIDLTEQSGTIADVAAKYALSGATETPTTGSPSLSIDMKAKVAILKIVNAGGFIDINIMNGPNSWVTGLTADDFSVVTSDTKTSIFSTSTAGEHFVVVPAGIQLSIKEDNGTVVKATTASGFTAGKYYTLSVNEAVWRNALPQSSYYTKVSIETEVSTPKPSDANNLNTNGDVWWYDDASTIRIQTPKSKIKLNLNNKDVGAFYDLRGITEIIGLENLDVSEAGTLRRMFSGCEKLASIDVSSFDTKSITGMEFMFTSCHTLTTLDLSALETSNVTDMKSMFYDCDKLTTLKLGFNTKNVTNMEMMFHHCDLLTEFDVSTFVTSNVEKMGSMFQFCRSVTTLSLLNFNTEKVTDMSKMFNSCSKLTTLDCSSFKTSAVTDMNMMFKDMRDCESLTLSDDFDMSAVIDKDYMFSYCGWNKLGTGGCTVYGVNSPAIKSSCKTGTEWNSLGDLGIINIKFEGE